MTPRLLGDENTSHRLMAACRRLEREFPIVHLAAHNDAWLGAYHMQHSLVRTPVDREESASSPRLPSVEAAAGFQD